MVDVRSPLDERRSPLLAESDPAAAGNGAGDLRLSHAPLSSLVQIAGWGTAFGEAITPLLHDLALSGLGDYHTAQTGADCVSFRTGPDSLLIWHQTAEAASDSLAKLDPSATPILDLSHSRVHVRVEGAKSRDLMMRLTTVDIRSHSFPISSFAQTTLHHTSTLIYRSGAKQYELLIPSSYAVSIWEYICLTAHPFGLSQR